MKFSNDRQWRDFAAAIHKSVSYPYSVTYPKIIAALRSGRDWFNGGAVRATNPLGGEDSEPGTERT